MHTSTGIMPFNYSEDKDGSDGCWQRDVGGAGWRMMERVIESNGGRPEGSARRNGDQWQASSK